MRGDLGQGILQRALGYRAVPAIKRREVATQLRNRATLTSSPRYRST